MRRRYTQRDRTAIHEAGHSVAAFVLGRSFKSVSIVPDDESLGRVQYVPLPKWFQPDIEVNRRTEQLVQRQIMLSYAGPVAERLLTGRSTGSSGDYHKIVQHLSSYFEGGEGTEEALLR